MRCSDFYFIVILEKHRALIAYVLLITANISNTIYKELGFNTVCAGLGTGNGQVLIATHKLSLG